ncbi:hypothetical protein HDV05_004403 [Chytridiales sp. JEL 0842]|nr:hypothetical protein HDV05_004403 [Chytridiales sp. JEL 0842]
MDQVELARKRFEFENNGYVRLIAYNNIEWILKVWQWKDSNSHFKVRLFDTRAPNIVYEKEESNSTAYHEFFERKADICRNGTIERMLEQGQSMEDLTLTIFWVAYPDPLIMNCIELEEAHDAIIINERDLLRLKFDNLRQDLNSLAAARKTAAAATGDTSLGEDGTASAPKPVGPADSVDASSGKTPPKARDGGYNIVKRLKQQVQSKVFQSRPPGAGSFRPPAGPPGPLSGAAGPYAAPPNPPPNSAIYASQPPAAGPYQPPSEPPPNRAAPQVYQSKPPSDPTGPSQSPSSTSSVSPSGLVPPPRRPPPRTISSASRPGMPSVPNRGSSIISQTTTDSSSTGRSTTVSSSTSGTTSNSGTSVYSEDASDFPDMEAAIFASLAEMENNGPPVPTEPEYEEIAVGLRLPCKNTLIIGGTNVGKRTIINHLIGEPRCRSEAGLVEFLLAHENTIIKSPNFENPKEDFERVAGVVNAGGEFQVIFIMRRETLKRDFEVMQTVLMKIEEKISYGIIINNVESGTYFQWAKTRGGWDAVGHNLFNDFDTEEIFAKHYLPSWLFIRETRDFEKPIPDLPDFLRSFKTTTKPSQTLVDNPVTPLSTVLENTILNSWRLNMGRCITWKGTDIASDTFLDWSKWSKFMTLQFRNETTTRTITTDTDSDKTFAEQGWNKQALDIGIKRHALLVAKMRKGRTNKALAKSKVKHLTVERNIHRCVISIDAKRLEILPQIRQELQEIVSSRNRSRLVEFFDKYGDVLLTQVAVGGAYRQTTSLEEEREEAIKQAKRIIEFKFLYAGRVSGTQEKDEEKIRSKNVVSDFIIHGGHLQSMGLPIWSSTITREDPTEWEIIEVLDSIPVVDLFPELKAQIEKILMAGYEESSSDYTDGIAGKVKRMY